MRDRLPESFGISRCAVATRVRTDSICTGRIPANLLRTPRRARSCRLFAGSTQAQSISEHFPDAIRPLLQIQFERVSVNLLRELLHLLELSIRHHLCGQKMVRRGAPAEFLFHDSCDET